MIEEYAQSLVHFLQANPNWGGLITFFVAFLESLAIIGTIIPGSVTMTGVGMLIGTSILPFGMTALWATFGAFLGDLIGYWFGFHYNERIRKMWPFKKHPEWLERGESFFRKHGGKSIIIGRFIGPLRSIIPMIAGLLQMPWPKFVLAALPSAYLWSVTYMLPGILIGSLSSHLPRNVATKFILYLLLFIVVLSLFAWLITVFSTKIKKVIGHLLESLWDRIRFNKKYEWLTQLISNPNHPEDYQQLGWVILASLCFIIFLVIAVSVFQHNLLTAFNRPIFEFLRSIRNAHIDQVMIAITLLGQGLVVVTCAVFLLGWLLWHKNYRDAGYWFIAVMAGLIIPNVLKYILYFPRPTGLLHVSSTSSFPSGHSFLSTVFYGFFATFANTHIKKRYRRYLYYFVTCIILLVGFSRIYLGAHWLTDVLASIALGCTSVALITMFYRRKILPFKILNFTLFVLASTLVTWVSFAVITYHSSLKRYSLDWPSQVIDENIWWGHLNPALPIYRQNRLGNPAEPMNIQYSGNIQLLKNILTSEGWTANPNMTLLKNALEKLSKNEAAIIPFLPSLYLNRPPVLYMLKDTPTEKLMLKLWTSNVYLSGSWDVVFIGNVMGYRIVNKKNKITYSYNVLEKFTPYMERNEWRIKIITADQIPSTLFKKFWKGEILQVSTPALY
ncbi:MAG: VTT domain-containing protein [Gammaproteobacteria bacterium]|nr:VTT domain-containing protein [Gammaproteobacteria bacterium]